MIAVIRAAGEFRIVGAYLSARALVLLGGGIVVCQLLVVYAANKHASAMIGLLLVGAQLGIILGTLLWSALPGFRASLRRQLLEMGIPVCWGCGYDLVGSGPEGHLARCPECGRDCCALSRRLQRLLPEAAVFPELCGFADEHAARTALSRVRARMGPRYRWRLAIAFVIGVTVTLAFAFLLTSPPIEHWLDQQARSVRGVIFVSCISAAVWAMLAWYASVRRHVRAGLAAELTREPNQHAA